MLLVKTIDLWTKQCKNHYVFFNEAFYGNFASDKYELLTNMKKFEIEHRCGFINIIKTRLIPIQENSDLTKKIKKKNPGD